MPKEKAPFSVAGGVAPNIDGVELAGVDAPNANMLGFSGDAGDLEIGPPNV